jgi:hypothetical protein
VVELTEEQAYDMIVAAGATRAIVSFSGGGDEGGADSITLTNEAGDLIAELEPYAHGATGHQELTAYLEDLPSSQYGSFNDDVFVDGTILVDAVSRTTAWSVIEETADEAYEE